MEYEYRPMDDPEEPIRRRLNYLALTGFILAFFCGPAGLIVSLIAYKQIARDIGSQYGWGFAKAGIGLGIGLGILQIIYGAAFVSSL